MMSPSDAEQPKILVADDNIQNVELVMQSLGDAVKKLEKRLDKLEGKK